MAVNTPAADPCGNFALEGAHVFTCSHWTKPELVLDHILDCQVCFSTHNCALTPLGSTDPDDNCEVCWLATK